MKLAIFSDIHGNLPAFNAFLRDAREQGATDYVCLGDAANFGPQPTEALHALRKLNCPVVMGNTDDYLLTPRTLEALRHKNKNSQFFLDVEGWCARQLYAEEKRFVRTFQPCLKLSFDDLSILAYHGSPKSFNDIIVGTTSDESLDNYFEGQDADLYFGGHTHTQFVRRYHDKRVMNPGSVGLAFVIEKTGKDYRIPIAEYALLEVVAGEPNTTFRRVPYNVDLVIQAALDSGMPHVEKWLGSFRRSQA